MIRKTTIPAFLAFVVWTWTAIDVTAQSGSRGRSHTRDSRQQRLTPEEFQRRFWEYLTKSASAYERWGPFTGKQADIYEGQSPHGAYLKLYANRAARENPKSLPDKSILVKENYADDRRTLKAITVMYRSRGYDPEHNDWYWIKYLPDGKVAKTPPEKGGRPIAGRFASCIECHTSADDNDYVFAND